MTHLIAMNWDFADQLKSTEKAGETTHYVYSGGERVRKVVVDTTGTEKKKYERIYLGGYELYRKYDSSENLDLERETHKVMDDQRMIAILEVKTVSGGNVIANGSRITKKRYQYTNHLNSACLELNGTAQILSYEEYHPFGTTSYSLHTNDSEVSLKRYRYVHKERDDETGLYYYGARYYAPWLRRFVSVDPLKDKYPFYTSYQYAGNKPIISVDIDGLESNVDIGQQDQGVQMAKELGLMPDQLWNSAVEGGFNLIAGAVELFQSDETEGGVIRKKLEEIDVNVPKQISDETLGEAFKIRKVDGQVTVVPETGFFGDLQETLFAALDVAAVVAPSKGGGAFLAVKTGVGVKGIRNLLKSLYTKTRTPDIKDFTDVTGSGGKLRKVEAEAGALLEFDTGLELRSFTKRDQTVRSKEGDYIVEKGKLNGKDVSGKSIDHVGPPMGAKFDFDKVLSSVEGHFTKGGVDLILIDTRALNDDQFEILSQLLNQKYSDQLSRTLILR